MRMNNGCAAAVPIERLRTVDSTNDYLKRKLAKHELDVPFAVLAERQTNGHGRNGRQWLNTRGALLMSIALSLDLLPPEKYSIITLAAAVSVNSCFMQLGLETKIKWPNDIWHDGKKLCGILTSLVIGDDSRKYAIVGIGANVNADVLPTGLMYEAASVKNAIGRLTDIDELCCGICADLVGRMDDIVGISDGGERLCAEYRQNSMLIGSDIIVHTVEGAAFEAFAEDIDSIGRLVIIKKTGEKILLSAADVSVQKK